MLQEIAALQQEIYRVLAGEIRTFAGEGSWFALAAFVPLGIAFGAVHALMPGHGKSVLALYLAGSPASLARGLATALALSLTLFALPVVSFVLGSAGRAPLLEDISRGLLGLIGIWMLYRAVRRPVDRHHAAEGVAVGAIAGLVPCPLTLFVMTYSVSRGAPGAGLAFAAIMMIGVAVTLCFVAWASIFARQGLLTLIAERPALVDRTMRSLEGCAGVVFLAIAVFEFL